jgi:IS30 family transposase
VSTESIYQHIWKDKREFVFKSTNNWEKVRKRGVKKDSRGVLSNRRLIEDRPKIVDLKATFWRL